MPEEKQLSAEELAKQLEETTKKLDEEIKDESKEDDNQEDKDNEKESNDENGGDEGAKEDGEEGRKEGNETDEEDDNEEEVKPTEEELQKKRYEESSNEARKLAADEKIINDAFHEAHNLPAPTAEELTVEYPEWDVMSDVEKRLATENLVNKRRFAILDKAAAERKTVEEWNSKVDTYIEDPKTLIANPDLEGKEAKFKEYAKDKNRRNSNFGMVVSAFLHDYESTKVKHKGQMFETGKGGDKEPIKPKSDKLSIEEGRRLMQTNYNKYRELLEARKIAME